VEESPADPLDDPADLMSVGLGFRYEFEDSLKFRLDYGFRLEDLPAAAVNDDDGAVHFGLIYVF
jgi:hemolysin activation/secretion protein